MPQPGVPGISTDRSSCLVLSSLFISEPTIVTALIGGGFG